MTTNYHTHTYRCKHSIGDVQDYVNAAREGGLKVLGISDHSALPDNRWLSVRMSLDMLDEYTAAIEKGQRDNPDLTILKGMECDWDPVYQSFYLKELVEKRQYNYLVGAVHWYLCHGEWLTSFDVRTPEQLQYYTEFYIQGMHSGIYSFMAHPDVFGCAYEWDSVAEKCSRAIISCAEELKLPLEINGNGFRKPTVFSAEGERYMYPLIPFWQLASEYNIDVVCNSDAHRPEEVAMGIADGLDIARENGLRVIDKIKLYS